MFGNFDEEARKVLKDAKKEMMELHHPYIGSEHLLLAILKYNNSISERLKIYNLDYDIFKKELMKVVGVGTNDIESFLYTPLLKRIIENAIEDSRESDNRVTIEHLFSAMLEEGEGVALRILLGMNIDLEKLYEDFLYKVIVPKNSKNKKMIIDDLGIDLVAKAKMKKLDPVIGREKEIQRVIEILSRRNKNNPLLIGCAGVGKTAIVEGLAYLIANELVPLNLRKKRIVSIDMASLVAGTKYRGEFEDRLTKIINEVTDSDTILFIDEIHTLVGAGGAEGAIDASNIFKPALARGSIMVIGATTEEEYKKTIALDKALSRRFQNVMIKTPDKKTTKEILMGLKPIYEKYHNVIISVDIISLIIDLCDRYIHNRYEPDKSIDILDEVCAYVSLKETKDIKTYNKINQKLNDVRIKKNQLLKNDDYKNALIISKNEKELISKINYIEQNMSKSKKIEVNKKDVAHVFNMKTGIPVYELLNNNIKSIMKLSKELKNKIIGQDDVLNICVDIIKKIKLGFSDNECYGMLFIGPNGVGKTLMANLFASSITNNIIRLDGSDYSDAVSITKITGSSPGYVGYMDNTNILEEVKNNPFSVIIIDDIENMHRDIINIFIQILNDGKVRNAKGEYVYFNNSIIIMTTSVGSNIETIGFKNDNKSLNISEVFNNSFANAIDNIIYFNKLKYDDVKKIINLKLNMLRKKYKSKNINIKITNNVIEEIIKKSNYEKNGVKKVDRIIKDDVENIIINAIINNNDDIKITSIENVLI